MSNQDVERLSEQLRRLCNWLESARVGWQSDDSVSQLLQTYYGAVSNSISIVERRDAATAANALAEETARKDLADTKKEAATTRAALADTQKALADTQKALAATHQEAAAARNELAAARQELKNQKTQDNAELENCKAKLENCKAKLENCKAKLENCKAKLAELKDGCDAELAKSRDREDKLRESLKGCKRKLAESKGREDRLCESKEICEVGLAECEADKVEIYKSKQYWETECAKSQADLAQSKDREDKLRESLKDCKRKLAECKGREDRLCEPREICEVGLAECEADKVEIYKSKQYWETECAKSQADLAQSKESEDKLRQASEDYKSRYNQANDLWEELTAKHDNSIKTLARYLKERDDAKRTLQQEQERLRLQYLADTDASKAEYETLYVARKRDLEAAFASNAADAAELLSKEKSSALQRHDVTIDSVNQRLAAMESNLTAIQSSVTAVHSDVTTGAAERRTVAGDVRELVSTSERLQTALAQISVHLQSAEAKRRDAENIIISSNITLSPSIGSLRGDAARTRTDVVQSTKDAVAPLLSAHEARGLFKALPTEEAVGMVMSDKMKALLSVEEARQLLGEYPTKTAMQNMLSLVTESVDKAAEGIRQLVGGLPKTETMPNLLAPVSAAVANMDALVARCPTTVAMQELIAPVADSVATVAAASRGGLLTPSTTHASVSQALDTALPVSTEAFRQMQASIWSAALPDVLNHLKAIAPVVQVDGLKGSDIQKLMWQLIRNPRSATLLRGLLNIKQPDSWFCLVSLLDNGKLSNTKADDEGCCRVHTTAPCILATAVTFHRGSGARKGLILRYVDR